MSTLTNEQIVKAWRDPEYRGSLTAEQLAEFQSMSENDIANAFADPSMAVELTDEELEAVAGGVKVNSCQILSC